MCMYQITAIASILSPVSALFLLLFPQLAMIAMQMYSPLMATPFVFPYSSCFWGKKNKKTRPSLGVVLLQDSFYRNFRSDLFSVRLSREQWVASPRQETCVCLALGGWVTSSSCPPRGHALLCADTKTACLDHHQWKLAQ